MKKLFLVVVCAAFGFAQTFSAATSVDAQTEKAIADGLFPGAVVLVGQNGRVVYRKAYGQRALVPARETMTLDTIFDVASLTKVVAATPAMMKLVEQGKVKIDDPVTKYLPEFQGGKSAVTVRDLMTHFSGLRPDLDLSPEWSGYDTGINKALNDKPAGPPKKAFVYSDINFELIGEIVRRVSGKPLNEFTADAIYRPLGMNETSFLPAAALRARIAPTEVDAKTGQPWRGIVHDPTARFMGGVAGHAGLFSTADDLAKYAEAMLNARIVNAAVTKLFTTPQGPPDQPVLRGLGWDIDSPYSSNRGDRYPIGSYGHTGFTGTSLWIDPKSNSYVIILTNRVHPKDGRSINAYRRALTTTIADALGVKAPPIANHQVLNGIDVLASEKFASLKGKHVGLITNQTGIDRAGKRSIDVLKAGGVDLVALYSPEHGINGTEDRPDIANSKDAASGLPVWSLYNNGKYRLTAEMLKGVDTVLFDIQDVGARYYTYSCTMLYALEESAKSKVAFWVLDRPNPVTGDHVEGPMMDDSLQSNVGCYSLPVRHGLTMGELATMANAERKWNANLNVVKLKNWSRFDWFDSTNLMWVDPSPNMRSLNAATLYTGLALIESSRNLSVGRGTDSPFEQIGADFIDGVKLAEFLNARLIPGVRVYPTRFTPNDSNFKGRSVGGVRFVVTDREELSSTQLGLEIAYALQTLYPGKIDFEASRLLLGNRKVVDALKSGTDPRDLSSMLRDGITAFEARRKPYLLY